MKQLFSVRTLILAGSLLLQLGTLCFHSHGAAGDLGLSFDPGSGVNGTVNAAVLQPDGNILISGTFITVNGVLRPHVARLYGDSPWPSLNIVWSNAFLLLSWPTSTLNFQLQQSTNLPLPNAWSLVAQPRMTNGVQTSVTVPTTVEQKFFRLRNE